jgi:superfamily II DNA/RNA helicase
MTSSMLCIDMGFEPSIREILLQIPGLSDMKATQGAKGKKVARSASTTQVLLFTATWPKEVRAYCYMCCRRR